MTHNTLAQEYVRSLFDYRDGCLLWRKSRGKRKAGSIAGGVNPDGYIRITINYVPYFAHRLVFLWHHGTLPNQIDHLNRDRSDNRIENLREATQQQNCWNREGVRGTWFQPRSGRWCAGITAGQKEHLGTFDSEEEAHRAYLEAKARVHLIGGEIATCKRST